MKARKRFRGFIIICIVAALLFPLHLVSAENNFPLKRDSCNEMVTIIQQRLIDLGYLHYRTTGYYGYMTYLSAITFQQQNQIAADGMVGEDTYAHLYDAGKTRAPLNPAIKRIVGAPLMQTPLEYGALSEWETIDKAFPVGATATVTDFNTLKKYKVQRTGGTNHADVQTVSSDDHKSFLQAFGGGYSWEKRAVLVEINGTKYAGSIFGMPNTNDKLKNGFMDGSVCLYFSGSVSDIGGIPDDEHNANIIRAGGQ